MYTELNSRPILQTKNFKGQTRAKEKSPIVETFSVMAQGDALENLHKKFGKEKVETCAKAIKELGSKASMGDTMAKVELNSIQEFLLAPKLQEMVKLFSFMGTFKDLDYSDAPMGKKYKHESIRANSQAIGGDVPFGTTQWDYVPITTKNMSTGYAVNYREVASGNLDKVQEGLDQTLITLMNLSNRYVISELYKGVSKATGIKYFAESKGITKPALDDIMKKVRRNGKPSLCGDFSVVSQITPFAGVDTGSTTKLFSEEVLRQLMEQGLLSWYNGSAVVELPNQYDKSTKNADGSNFKTLLPEGLLFVMPQATVAPLQIIRRGGISSMTAQDIYTGQEITRFDMEMGTFFDQDRADEVGLISDTNFEVPAL